MKRILAPILASFISFTSAHAQTIKVDIDIASAQRLLDLSCSDMTINETEFRSSPALKSQIKHHSAFGKRFSMDSYLAGLNAMVRCKVSKKDPFRFKSLVEKKRSMEKAIGFLSTHRSKLMRDVHQNIAPFLPADFEFDGKVILAAASFSCGGFSQDGIFFVDLPCLAPNIEGEYEAIAKLIAHEAYHAMQNRFASKPMVAQADIATPEQAWDFMFHRLAIEGSAAHVGDMRTIEGDGRYAKFSRDVAKRSFRHLGYNFRLFGFMMEAIGAKPDQIQKRMPDIYGLAFDGSFGELSYFMGQQMTAEIAHSFGTRAIPCILTLPPENFALAYQKALADEDNLKQSHPLSVYTMQVAERIKLSRPDNVNLRACLTLPKS